MSRNVIKDGLRNIVLNGARKVTLSDIPAPPVVTPPVDPGTFNPGPTGLKRPPNWPYAYNKPATVTVTSWSGLTSALASAQRGDVIETNFNLTGSNQTLTGGPTYDPTLGILIRPPLGTRRQISSLTNKAAHGVILAGYDIVTDVRAKAVNSTMKDNPTKGFFLWRCRGLNPLSRIAFSGVSASGLVEVVLQRCLNAPTDRTSMYADGACDSKDWYIDGCYLGGGVWATTQTPFAALTLENVGNGTYTTTVTKAGVIKNIIAGFPTTPRPWSCTLSVRINGNEIWKGDAPVDVGKIGGDIADFGRAISLSYTVAVGDQVDFIIENASTTFPRIDVAIGPSNGTHCDTIQWGTSYTGGLSSGRNGGQNNIIRDTVLQGSSNCVIHSTPSDDSEWLYERSWFGRGAGSGSIGTALLLGTVNGPKIRLRGNVFSGGVPRMQQIVENVNNIYRGLVTGLDPSNVVGQSTLPYEPPAEPTKAQLAAIWPECPPV